MDTQTPTSPENTNTNDTAPTLPEHAVPDPSNPGSSIVSASIAPIKAADLRNVGPMMKSGEHDHGMSGSGVAAAAIAPMPAHEIRIPIEPQPAPVSPGDPSLPGKARAAGQAVQIFAPIFDVPPITRIVETRYLRVAAVTLDRAQTVALDIIAAPGVDDPAWQKLRTMAKVYASSSQDETALAAANECAAEIVALMESLPISPMSADAMSLAFATISRANERRENGPPTP